jgi:hypothetical protein
MGGADEFGAAPEFRARARCCNFSHRLAPPDKRAGISLKARPGFNRDGFAGEQRLIDEDGAVYQSNIGGNNGTERQLHHVSLHQFGRR